MEYGTALRYLDDLLRQLKPEELAAVDAIVSKRAEFTVYTNIARRVQSAPTSLVPPAEIEQGKTERRGLPWVLALARVELGGILATFGSHPSPFEAVGPSQYEMPAYKQLLLDGAETHYWALAQDPEARRIAKIDPTVETLAYIRRLSVARHFLYAAIRSNAAEINQIQLAEAMVQKENLDKLRNVYSSNVADYLASLNYSKQSTTSKTTGKWWLDGCRQQLAKEPQALATGGAVSKRFDTP